jgi:hypothetical protein
MELKEQLENHLIVILAGVIVVAGSIAWTASEKIRVEPRDREVDTHGLTPVALAKEVCIYLEGCMPSNSL